MSHPFFINARHPRVFAHQGLATDDAVWGNTAGAFAAAHAAGAEYIETDCRSTADGDVVLVHDETLEHLTGDPRPVSTVRTRELREIFAGHGGLLTIGEALDAFPDIRFNIDVKSEDAVPWIGRPLVAHTRRVLLTSFSDARRRRAVDEVRWAGAEFPPATSAGRNTIATLLAGTALRLTPMQTFALREVDALQIPEAYGPVPVLTPRLIRLAHAHGVEVHVWTINDPDRMRELVSLGVDGIVTDRADVALETLG